LQLPRPSPSSKANLDVAFVVLPDFTSGALHVLQKKSQGFHEEMSRVLKNHHILMTGGGNSNIFYVHPETWGR